MREKGFLFTGLVLVLIIGSSFPAFAQQGNDFYQRGMQAAENENYEEAIDIWLQGKGALDTPSTRIGTAFIALVTQQKMRDYYEFATLMYEWGLSAEQVEPNKETLREEVERLRVLVDFKTFNRWSDLLRTGDPQIYDELSAYWKQQDLTPTTGYNERLIEHWERIAYSRDNFDRSRSGVFNADDRADIYVRYGKPDVKRSGQLNFNGALASSYIDQIANTPQVPFDKVGSSIIQTFVRNAQNYHSFPKYEVWVYNKSASRSSKAIFLFGSNADTGEFQMVESIEDFIPNAAFSSSRRTLPGWNGVGNPRVDNIRPGLILQLIYYNQLSTADMFFGDMFNRITARAVDINTVVNLSLAQEMQNAARFELIDQRAKIPKQASAYNDLISTIPVQVYQYRLLDGNNNPYLATFVESRPQRPFLIDYVSNYGQEANLNDQKEFKNYRYTHSLQIYNADNELTNQLNDQLVLVASEKSASITQFDIPAVAEGTRQVFTARLENTDPSSAFLADSTPFPQPLRGLGRAEVMQPAPLTNSPGQLQVGDLILGYNYDESAGLNESFPFTIANARKIPENEDLVLHFEVYHMAENQQGIHDTKLSYQIEPESSGLFDWFRSRESNFRLTLNLESNQPVYIQNLQIQTRELKPGSYRMLVEITDPVNGQAVEREFGFEIVESD